MIARSSPVTRPILHRLPTLAPILIRPVQVWLRIQSYLRDRARSRRCEPGQQLP